MPGVDGDIQICSSVKRMWVLNSARDIRHMFWYGMVRVGWVECCDGCGVVGKIIL